MIEVCVKENLQQEGDIKKQKGDYWSRPGAGTAYEAGISSPNGTIQIKNRVEQEIVLRNANGFILDAGTGTGRFAIALAKNTGNSVTALDYSLEMLAVNRELSSREGINNIEYVQGDIENMKFPSDRFDSVVSITVVRHFPEFKKILQEYTRVLKPGGRIIFEMCSGDHMEAANRLIPKFGVKYNTVNFENYELEITRNELISYLNTIGIDIIEIFPYDFLNNNCFLKIISISAFGYKVMRKFLDYLFRLKTLQALLVKAELSVLKKLPTSLSYNFMIIGSKRH